MATEIDKRVVQMQFDNKDFEKNCKQSLTTLEKLKMALNFDGAKGLETMGKAASKVDLSNLSKGADAVKVKFDALQIAGMTAIQELTRGLINFGKNVWNNTFGQIKTGGWARTLKIDQANFQMKALAENLDIIKSGAMDVTQYMDKMSDSISEAVNNTAYGYDAAASIASQLMASNITNADEMYNHLRAVAGSAAMTGRSFEELGFIFTRVASNGRVMGDDLQSFSSRGLNLASILGKELNKTEAEIRDMVSKGKITFKDFSDALYKAFGEAAGRADETWSGVTSNVRAQLSRIGQLFTDPMVKNLIPVLAELKLRIKDVNKALQPVANTWTKFFEYVTKKMKTFLETFKATGIKNIIHSIENVLVALIEIIWTIGRAIREVFPTEVQNEFKSGLQGLEMFTRTLIPSKEALEDFKEIIKAILIPIRALWTIGVAVVKYAIKPMLTVFINFLSVLVKVGYAFKPVIKALLDIVSDGTFISNVLEIVVSTLVAMSDILLTILDCVIELIASLTRSGTFQLILDFLTVAAHLLGKVIVGALEIIFGLVNLILNVINPSRIEAFFGFIIDILDIALGMLLSLYISFTEWLDQMSQGDTIFGKIIAFLSEIWELVKNLFAGNDISNNLANLKSIIDDLGNKVKAAWEKFREFLHGMDAGKIIVYAFAIAMILLVLSIRGLFDALTDAVKAVTGGIKDLVGIFSDIRGFLQGMIKMSPALQVILGLIGLLWSFTACFVILSDLEWDGIAKAGVALGAFGAGLLVLALVLSKIKFAGFQTALQLLPAIMGLAIAICASAAAIAILGRADISLKRLVPALISVAALLALLSGALILLQLTAGEINTIVRKNMMAESKQVMVSAGVVIAFGISVGILAIALWKLSELPIKEAMIGLALVSGMLLSLAGAMAIINWSGAKFSSALGIALFIGSFILLLKSIQKLSELPFEDMMTGLKNAGSVLSMIAIFFTVTAIIGKKGGNILIHNITGLFTSLAILIAATTATIFLLRKMSTEAISKGIGVVIMLSVLFTLVVRSLLKSLNTFSGAMKTYKDASILKSFSKFLATFSVCLSAIVVAGILAKKMDTDAFGKIIAVMIALTACIWVLAKASAHTKRAKTGVIITFIAGIVAMMSMMTVMTLTDPDNLMQATLAVVGLILALSVLAFAAGVTAERIEKAAKEGKESKFKNVALFVAFIMGVIGIISILIPLVKTAKEAESTKLAEAAIAVIAVLVTVIVSIGVLAAIADKVEKPDTLPKLIGPIIAVAASMILIVKAITDLIPYFNDLETSVFGLLGVSTALITFFAFVRLFEDLVSTVAAREVTPERLKALGLSLLALSSVFAVIAGCIAGLVYLIQDPSGYVNSLLAFGYLLTSFYTITEQLKTLIDKMSKDGLESSDLLKVAGSVLMISSVLIVIAGAITAMTLLLSNTSGWATFGVVLVLLGSFILVVGAVGYLIDEMKKNKLESSDLMKAAESAVLLSSVLIVIAGAITAMTLLLSNTSGWATFGVVAVLLISFVLIVGAMGYLMDAMKKKELQSSDLMKLAGSVVLLSSVLLVIASAILLMSKIGGKDPNGMASMLASWVMLLTSFGLICFALYKLADKGDSKKLLAAAGSIAIASTAFVIIAAAMSVLANAKVDEGFWEKMGALVIPMGLLVGFFIAVAAIGDKVKPLALLAAAGSLAIGAIAILIIAEAMNKMVNSFKNVSRRDYNKLVELLTIILVVLGILVAIGGIAGAFQTAGLIFVAAIGAMMGAFLLFAIGVDILAIAVEKFIDAILKINNVKIKYNTIKDNLSNGIQGACDAIIESAPNIYAALETLFTIVLAAITSIVGSVVALGVAFFLAFMDGILMALPEALRILSKIMQIIVDWLDEPGNLELFRRFFRDIGAMLVEIISGAIEGLFHTVFDYIDEVHDKGIKARNEAAKHRFTQEANEKMFNKAFNNTSVGSENDMYYYIQQMRINQELMSRYDEESTEYANALRRFENNRSVVHEQLQMMTYNDWVNMINYLNEYANNVKDAGGVLDQAFIDNVSYLQHIAPMEFRDRFNEAVRGIEPAVEEVTEEVKDLNEWLASPNTENVAQLNGSIEGAADSAMDLADSTEFVNEKLAESGEYADTFDDLKDKFGGAASWIKDQIKGINLKDAGKKLGVDAAKLGAGLGKITGFSFGNSYEEASKQYMDEAMEQVFDETSQTYKYKYEVLGYESAEAYAQGMIEGGDSKITYAAKKLFDFLGINIDIDDTLKKTIPDMSDFSAGLEGIGDSADKAKSKLEEFRDGVKDSIAEAMHGIFDEVSEQEYIDPDEMLYRMGENIRRVGEWARNISTLAARGMSEGLLNELKDMGPAGAAKVKAFVDMTDEQLRQANMRWSVAADMPDYGAKEIEKSYREAGYMASLGFSEGIDQTAANDAMGEMSDNALGIVKDKDHFDIQSPSKTMEKMGVFVTAGFAIGMTNNVAQQTIRSHVHMLTKMILDCFKVELKPDIFRSIGNNVINGLNDGIEAKAQAVLAKVRSLASQIASAFARVLAIKSPSRVMAELGEYTMEGLSIGMEDGSSEVEKVTEQTANDILNQMKAQIAAITNGWSEDNAYQPVIRPVFDMDGIQTGYNDIQSWFANAQGLNLSGNLTRLTPTTTDDSSSNQQIIDAINNINNDDVVREINNLRDDISNLQAAMTNMQVVMNTGALVGQLVEPMDKALGSKALIKNRGRY
jgi:tape measure domain-containing protein